MSNIFSKDEAAQAEAWSAPFVGTIDGVGQKSGAAIPGSMGDQVVRCVSPKDYEALVKEAHGEGYAKGFDEGRQAGHKTGQQEVNARLHHLQQLLCNLNEPFQQLDDQVEHELVEMVMVVAHHIIRRELNIQSGEVVAVVREAIAALPASSRDIRVALHPDDAQLVNEAMSMGGGEQTWRVVEDPSLSRGGCKVTAGASTVDATLETRIAAVVAQALGGERDGDSSV